MDDVKKCPKCGTEGSVTAYTWLGRYVCEACGVRWSVGKTDFSYPPKRKVDRTRTVYVCEECGLEQRPGAVQCPRCGAEFVEPVPVNNTLFGCVAEAIDG